MWLGGASGFGAGCGFHALELLVKSLNPAGESAVVAAAAAAGGGGGGGVVVVVRSSRRRSRRRGGKLVVLVRDQCLRL